MNSYQNFPFTSRIFKLVGVILILSFVIDFLILLFPSGSRNSQWQVGLATAVVDRGLIPMIGLALIFAGYWLDHSTINSNNNRKSWLDLRLWALFSSLLGLFFLLLIPIHINNVTQASAQTVEQINQEAKQAESTVQAQLGQLQAQLGDQRVKAELEKFRTQVKELLKDQQRFNQALQSNQFSENEKKLLQQFKANPQALDAYIAQQANPSALGNQKLNQIQTRRQELEQQARQDAWRSGLRVGINSLLFAIGYAAIGWTGLRNIHNFQSIRH